MRFPELLIAWSVGPWIVFTLMLGIIAMKTDKEAAKKALPLYWLFALGQLSGIQTVTYRSNGEQTCIAIVLIMIAVYILIGFGVNEVFRASLPAKGFIGKWVIPVMCLSGIAYMFIPEFTIFAMAITLISSCAIVWCWHKWLAARLIAIGILVLPMVIAGVIFLI